MYQVSNLGRVKSLPKLKRVTVFNKAHIKIMTKERIIGGSLDKSGYIQINLRKNRKIKKYRIHRLVAEAFLPPIAGCNIVNHKNGIKNDNRLSNLEWCTEKDNTHHCIYALKNKWWLCHEKAVEQYSLEGILIERYSSITGSCQIGRHSSILQLVVAVMAKQKRVVDMFGVLQHNEYQNRISRAMGYGCGSYCGD